MIQILGLREFFDEKKQKPLKKECFFSKGWRAESVAEIFAQPEKWLGDSGPIPKNQQWNLYYTAAQCKEQRGRILVKQEVMPFDVDGIDIERRKEYVQPVCKALGVDPTTTGVIFSGNGLQFLVGLKDPIQSVQYFEQHRVHYKVLCERINSELRGSGLPGSADASVFSPARLMRFPLTLNKKPNKPERLGELYNRTIQPVDFDIVKRSGLPDVPSSDSLDPQDYGATDTKGVLEECEFLKWCSAEPENVTEAQWYAMLSITARLENGNQLSHTLSEGHPGYTQQETESKIEQALTSSGPRTCKNIQGLWEGCSKCKHFEKCKSPILIQSENFIRTEKTGFHKKYINAKGEEKTGPPQYEDLRRFFAKKYTYCVMEESRICYVWSGTHWEEFSDLKLENFAQKHFDPPAQTFMVREFRELVNRTHLKPASWFVDSTSRKINFKNGILDLRKMEFGPHSSGTGFRYVLDYEYNPTAKCPKFEKFLSEITRGDAELENILMEFMGYAFSFDRCWAEKALICTGKGSNGKSTFFDVMKALAGSKNYSSLMMGDLKNEANRFHLDGKLFNIGEETPNRAMTDSSLFKAITTGGEMMVKVLYKKSFQIENKAKLIFLCNDLPVTKDTSRGYFRRLMIVPFNADFSGEARNPFILEDLLTELPGIFNLVVRGYQRLKDQKKFSRSERSDKELDRYESAINPVKAWVEDCVEWQELSLPDEKLKFAPIQSAFKAFRVFCEANNHDIRDMNANAFGKKLMAQMPGGGSDGRFGRQYIKSKRTRGVRGMIFSDGADGF